MRNKLYYVTGNSGKFNEVQSYLHNSSSAMQVEQVALDIPEIQTLDHEGVAIDKAQKAWAAIQKPLLIDDAGLYFEAYHRFPGVLTKFVFQGIGLDGILKLVEHDHRAYYLIYMVYIDGPTSFKVFEHRCDGKIIAPQEIKGDPNLPFDDIFVPIGSDKTYATLKETKGASDQFNCRIRALDKFLTWHK